MVSHYLKATNFGFAIPTGVTIKGIKVEIERKKAVGFGHSVKDSSVYIVKGGVIQTTQNKADTVTEWTTTDTYITYGSLTDLWGISWTAEDINDIGFGVVISVSLSAKTVSQTAYIDHIRITADYT